LKLPDALKNHPLLLGQIVVSLPFIHASLRIFGFHHTLGLLQKSPSRACADENHMAQPISQAIVMGQLANAVAHKFRMSCLDRSVLLWWLLRRRGAHAALVLGAPLEKQAQFVAHAWIEYNGTIINDTPWVRSHYAVLTAYENR
jgi:hypothetical protein